MNIMMLNSYSDVDGFTRLLSLNRNKTTSWHRMMQRMAESRPDIIYFFTTESTDIWED